MTFHPGGDESADCYIFGMAQDGGGLLPNVNRWRQQIGKGDLTLDEVRGLPSVKVLGEERPLLEEYGAFTGMDGKRIEDGGMLAVPCLLGQRAVFIKFTGPAPLVRAQKANFLEFCRSLKVEE